MTRITAIVTNMTSILSLLIKCSKQGRTIPPSSFHEPRLRFLYSPFLLINKFIEIHLEPARVHIGAVFFFTVPVSLVPFHFR